MSQLHPLIRKILIAFMALLILLALLIASLPLMLKPLVVYVLEQQGVETSIDKIEIDFDDAVLTVSGLHGVNQHGKGFSLGRFYIDIAWQPLFDRRMVIERIEISGLKLDAAQNAAGLLSVAGLDLSAQKNDVASAGEQDMGESWSVFIGNVLLDNILFCHELVHVKKSYCAALGEFDWKGAIGLDAKQPAESQPEINGSLTIDSIVLEDSSANKKVILNKTLALKELNIKGMSKVGLSELSLDSLQLLPGSEKQGDIFWLDKTQIQAVSFGDAQLAIEKIKLTGIGLNILRDSKGQWEVVQRLAEILPVVEKTTEQKPDEKADTSAEPLQVKVTELSLHDSHPILFSDQSLETPFELTTEIKTLALENVDTANKNQTSHVQIQLLLDKHGQVELAGDVQLLAAVRDFNINGTFKGIDLRPVGVYMHTGVGHRIKSGQLNADIKLFSEKGKLDSVLNLDLKHFQLKKLSAEEKMKMDQEMGLGLPLDTALNLLRDRDNSIKLKLPITGDVNNPEFDPSNVVYKAISTAMTSTIINYYTPFGLVALTRGIIDLATALRFDPVLFEAARVELTADAKGYLDKVVQLLEERPQIHVTLCATVNKSDLQVLQPEQFKKMQQEKEAYQLPDESKKQLHDVASKRSDAVKAYMVERGAASDRLVLCEPEYEADGVSGVLISL